MALLVGNRLIRHSLAAPRVAEIGEPIGLPWQSVKFPTVRGKTLFGWFIPAGERAPALAVIHGWGGNAETMLPLARPLHNAGFATLLFDARCHGLSDDDSFTSMPRFAEDLEHAIKWLSRCDDIDPLRVMIIGHSVGAGAALLAASRSRDIAAVVSLAAFTHPIAMMRRWFKAKAIPYRPVGWLILRYVEWTIGYKFDAIAPINTIRPVSYTHLTLPTSDLV